VLDYTAIDFETANAYRGSPCAVGLIRVRGGVPVESVRWLIQPPAKAAHFDGFNVALHGITPEMVRDAPTWQDMLIRITEYIGDDPVVAHNAGFDIGVIRYACILDGVPWPFMRFLCTLVLARKALRLPSYRLPFVTDALGFESSGHHDPLEDAKAVVGVVLRLAERESADSLDALASAFQVVIGQMSAGTFHGSLSLTGRRPIRPEANPDADSDGLLYGRVVVFTGALLSMTRQIAWEECVRVGAIPEQSPTKRTNVLVVGDINPAVLRPGSDITGKARKAFELQATDQDIEVMTEVDFARSLSAKELEASRR
jgi:DNA polymerase-3 subunit epsilon